MAESEESPAAQIERAVAAWDGVRVGPHRFVPKSGRVSYYLRCAADVAAVIELFRLNYDQPWAKP